MTKPARFTQADVTPDDGAKPYSVARLATHWECSEGLVRKLVDRGELQHFRIGGLIRIPASEVERYEECQNTASSGSAADMPSSITTRPAKGTANASMRPIGQARKPKPGSAGNSAQASTGR
jgi:excisionase family DNA binding protein